MEIDMKIEIRELKTHKVIKTVDCCDEPERTIEKIDRGININLNHDEYYTAIVD